MSKSLMGGNLGLAWTPPISRKIISTQCLTVLTKGAILYSEPRKNLTKRALSVVPIKADHRSR